MSGNRKRRKAVKFARYTNRYAHIPNVAVGEWKVFVFLAIPTYHIVCRQQHHRYGHRYRRPKG